MNDKILVLTKKIYSEGIEKGKRDAGLIISDAQEKAEDIIKSAREQERDILDRAKKQVENLKLNSESELRLAAGQFISNLKQEVTKLVVHKQTEGLLKETFNDVEFIQSIIVTMIKNWNPQRPEELSVKLLLPKKDEEKLIIFFNTKGKNLLDSGLEIIFDANVNSGFVIKPKEGTYYINFTDADFDHFFRDYLKDKTKRLLFG